MTTGNTEPKPLDDSFDPEQPRTKEIIVAGDKVEIWDTNSLPSVLRAYGRVAEIDTTPEPPGMYDYVVQADYRRVKEVLDLLHRSSPRLMAEIVRVGHENSGPLTPEAEQFYSTVMDKIIVVAKRLDPDINPWEYCR